VVHLRLYIIVFPWFLKDYCDSVLEVCRTVALFKACVEELEKTRKEDFKRPHRGPYSGRLCALPSLSPPW
jgi:hypothetical protein